MRIALAAVPAASLPAAISSLLPMRAATLRRMQGAALLSAMLVVSLVATLAAGTLWLQWREVEVEAAERARQQTAWLLLGAQDWARDILREDGQTGQTDHLQEPWANSLQGAPLSAFLARGTGGDTGDLNVELGIHITDSQSRLNVNNLVDNTEVSETVVLAFRRLFDLLALPESELELLVENLRRSRAAGQTPEPLQPQRLEHLTWLGVSRSTIKLLQPYVALLPDRTPLNLNTASAEVIYAGVPGLKLEQAQRLIRIREKAPFRSTEQALQAAGLAEIPADAISLSVSTRFFEVHGHLRRAQSQMQERWLLLRDDDKVITLSHERLHSRALPGE